MANAAVCMEEAERAYPSPTKMNDDSTMEEIETHNNSLKTRGYMSRTNVSSPSKALIPKPFRQS